MFASVASGVPTDVTQPTGFLHTLLTMSLTAVAVLRPLYAEEDETIRDFAWVYLNPAGQQMLGQPERPTGSLLTLFPAAQANGSFATYCQAFMTGETRRQQTNYQADGVDGYFLTVAQRHENVLLVNFTDTNDQPRSAVEEALRASQTREQHIQAQVREAQEELYRTFRQVPAAIAVYEGPQHVLTFYNEQYEQFAARSPELGRPAADIFPDLAAQGVFLALDQVYATGEPLVLVEEPAYSRHPETGAVTHRYFTLRYDPLRDRVGQVSGLIQTAVDVTEQVLARQQVQRLNEELETRVQERTRQLTQQQVRLERLLLEAPAAICMLDGPDLVFDLVNANYQRLFPNRLLLGKPVLEALPEIASGPVEDMLRGVYETGVTFEGKEVLMPFARPGDGQVEDRFFNFIYQARYNEADAIDGLLVFAFEVSSQVQSRQQTQQLNEALRRTNTQLTHTNTDLDTFVYAASHDLKAPIANIEGLLAALRDYLPADHPEPMVPRLLGMMDGAIERFQRTVGHLTDISRLPQAGELPTEELGLADVIEGVRLDLAALLESTRAQLLVDVASCPTVRFSTKNLRSILFNLLSNAIKYRDPGRPPVVQVRATCADGQVVLEVQDNGLGLSDEQQGQLFTMFKRLHTHVEGSGVGLYMLKRIVENADGTITVASQLGVGSTFTVTLPRA